MYDTEEEIKRKRRILLIIIGVVVFLILLLFIFLITRGSGKKKKDYDDKKIGCTLKITGATPTALISSSMILRWPCVIRSPATRCCI